MTFDNFQKRMANYSINFKTENVEKKLENSNQRMTTI